MMKKTFILKNGGYNNMTICKMCGSDRMITLDNICLICNPPTEKQIDAISTIMVLAMEHIKEIRNSS